MAAQLDDRHRFTRSQLENMLAQCIDKTLREVDVNHVLDKTTSSNKGVAGAVIEQSVLGYPADNARRPDLEVDGVPTELKTTGMRIPKAKKNRSKNVSYEAKEPLSVTAVKPEEIINEEFETSAFWSKMHHVLFVYYLYLYDSPSLGQYGDFPIKGFEFEDFDGEDKEALKQDWLAVREFARKTKDDDPQPQHISDELKKKLAVLDVSPRWGNHPRFRLKKTFVSYLISRHFGVEYENLPFGYSTYSAIDKKCHELREQYGGKTLGELESIFGVHGGSKSVMEQITIRMFGGTEKKLNKIAEFVKLGVIGKTIVFSAKGGRTEDMKFEPKIDFSELQDRSVAFDESAFKTTFAEPTFLFAVLQEPSHGASENFPYEKNIFLGFKRLSFSEEFIDKNVKPVYEKMRHLIFSHELKIVPSHTKDGKLRYNKKTGALREAPNWPKHSEGIVFVRGSGTDSSVKPEVVNGLSMYAQYLWVGGQYITQQLKEIPFL